MRPAVLLVAAALAALAGALALGIHSTHVRAGRAGTITTASSVGVMPPAAPGAAAARGPASTAMAATLPPPAATPPRSAAAAGAAAATTPPAPSAPPAGRHLGMPRSLAELPHTPAGDNALRTVTSAWGGSPQALANLDYRLQRLSDIADCTAGQIQHSGFVDVTIHFSAAAPGAQSSVERVELKKVHLDPSDRSLALRCIEKSIFGSHNLLADETLAANPRTGPMRIRFPVEDSGIYSFLETGDMRYYAPAYDGRP